MRFTVIEDDGITLRALLGAAEKLHEITEERNLALGMIDDVTMGDKPIAAVMAKRDAGARVCTLVTIERKPRVIKVERDV